MTKINCKLSNIRKRRNLKQTELSKLTGISQKALSDLERGKSKGVTFTTIAKICDALDITLDQLFEIVFEVAPDKRGVKLLEKPSCSFCGKNEDDVDTIIYGRPDKQKPKVYICSECIKQSNDLIGDINKEK